MNEDDAIQILPAVPDRVSEESHCGKWDEAGVASGGEEPSVKKNEEKPTPKHCICGKTAITVKSKSGTMLTCPDPLNCSRNIRTSWHRSGGANGMIEEWNSLVEQALYEARRRRSERKRR